MTVHHRLRGGKEKRQTTYVIELRRSLTTRSNTHAHTPERKALRTVERCESKAEDCPTSTPSFTPPGGRAGPNEETPRESSTAHTTLCVAVRV